jgi:hypothetical protein
MNNTATGGVVGSLFAAIGGELGGGCGHRYQRQFRLLFGDMSGVLAMRRVSSSRCNGLVSVRQRTRLFSSSELPNRLAGTAFPLMQPASVDETLAKKSQLFSTDITRNPVKCLNTRIDPDLPTT